jgi:uncharacterized protein (TIGR02453 family)
MSTAFPGFSRRMPAFFRGLAANNTREWFAAHKEEYEDHVRRPLIELTALLNDALRKFAVDYVVADPARAPYRIYRDTRFSKDKTPYKTHAGVTFPHRGLPKHAGGGFYFSVSHREVEIAGGVYMPGPEELAAIRQAIAADPREFRRLAEDRRLVRRMGRMQGEKLKRPPKGCEDADPAVAEYLKHKQFYWYITMPAAQALSPRLGKTLLDHFRLMAPVVDWLSQAVLAPLRRETHQRPQRPAGMW